jgi:o-succinylbenzoate synthase
VKIRRARLTPYGLPLTRRLRTAHGWLDERRGWLLEFETDSGARGRGDACPFPGLPVSDSAGSGFGMESWRICGQRLEALAGSLLGRSIADRAALGEACATLAPDAPAARFAVDCALHELAAVVRSSSVADLLADASGTRPQPSLAVNALVSASRPGEIAAEAVTLREAGFETFKLKLGGASPAADLQRVEALRAALGPGPLIRLDANGAWSRQQASSLLRELKPLEIELIEQPVAADDIAGLLALRRAGHVPIAADESLADPAAARALIATHAADVLVLKPAVLGGLAAALGLAREAAAAGMGCFVTGLMDSALGLGAATHLAAALPDGGFAHGLGTSTLFDFDLATGPEIRSGRLQVPAGPGWGIETDSEGLARAGLGEAIEVSP